MRLRFLIFALVAILMSPVLAQRWADSYERGLANAKKAKWADARKNFLDAVKARSEDSDKGSTVGGSVADRRPWREGAPYSANFAAAYCAMKAGLAAQTADERSAMLKDSVAELTKLVDSGKESLEALIFLATAQAAINDNAGSSATQLRAQKLNQKTAFRVDREVIAEEDLVAFQTAVDPNIPANTTPISDPNTIITLPRPGSDLGLVQSLPYKFALLIGNQTGSGQAFAQTDVDAVKESLIKDAGYAEENIFVVKEGTVEQMLAAANAAAEKIPDNGILFFYFSGAAAHDAATGKDYLSGIDTPSDIAYSRMLAKTAVFQPFVRKGCAVFSFFQTDRKMTDGKYFGLEVPQVGKISQCFGVIPGEYAQGLNFDGQFKGIYTAGITTALKKLRNNRIAIQEFAWTVFDVCREGLGGVGGSQTPSLPVTTGMTGAARF
ncbi:MAG: caspase family protein [Fimbriimonadales bacterium]